MMENNKIYELSEWNKSDEKVIGTYDTLEEAEQSAEEYIEDNKVYGDMIISKWNDNLDMYMPVKWYVKECV